MITAATSYPVSVSRAKDRLRIDVTANDADLLAIIKAATLAVEHETGRMLAPSAWEYRTDCWDISIPLAPVRTITSITYLDTDHAEQTINPVNYYWHETESGAEVHFIDTYSFPTLSNRDEAITVSFESGYDDTGSGTGGDPTLVLPPTLELAVLFLVGHWYERREMTGKEEPFRIPNTFEFLASQLRVYR